MQHAPTSPTNAPRIFLVVVDQTEEMTVALRYAARRAKSTGGRVALLTVITYEPLQHWAAVEELMRQEQRQEAEQRLQELAAQVTEIAGTMPIVYLREGDTRDQLIQLIAEEPSISILVLAAGTSGSGPGPLVSYLTGRAATTLRIPITIVPGNLSPEQLAAIS